MASRWLATALPMTLGWVLFGCSTDAPPQADSAPPQPAAASASEPVTAPPRRPFTPIATSGDGSIGASIVLGSLQGRRLLFIADEDAGAVLTVDIAKRSTIASTRLKGSPSQILIAGDGRLYATLRDRDEVVALESTGDATAALEEGGRMETAVEPVGLAASPDKRTLFVTSGWGHSLAAFSLETMARIFTVDLPREPRAIAVAEDGRRVFVSHVVGSMISVISLGEGAPAPHALSLKGADIGVTVDCRSDSIVEHKRFAVQGFALASLDGRVYAPLVTVHPEAPDRSMGGYGSSLEMFPTAELSITSIDASTAAATMRVADAVYAASAKRSKTNDFNPPAFRQVRPPCLLPRAVVVDGARSSLLVACAGIDSILELDTKDAKLDRSEMGRWKVPAGPMGIAVDTPAREAFVWSRFDREVSALALGEPNQRADTKTPIDRAPSSRRALSPAFTISMPAAPSLPSDIALGRRLFHAVGDKRISFDGRACASCHPDGRDDGLVWSTPEGKLQTPMLAGRLAGTAPYGWTGSAKTVEQHLTDTFKRLGGKGLTGPDLAALIAYAMSLEGPVPARPIAADPRVQRGHDLFTSNDTMCSLCHTEGRAYTDGSVHDVSSGIALETPSLRFVAGTPPYFHDGRYATLRDLITGSAGKMGEIKHLGEDDLAALEAYIETL